MKIARVLFFSFVCFFASSAFGVTRTITFSGFSFSPSSLNCNVGDVINFVGSFSAHIIQSTSVPAGAGAFGPTSTGASSFSYTVTAPGTYNYQCNIHAAMGMTGSFTAADVPGVKAITLSPTTLSFGDLRVGNSTTKTATLNSVGPDLALTISQSSLKTGVNFSSSPTTTNRVIPVGGSETETITFKPTERGSFTDVLTIFNDATAAGDQNKTITVTGRGINGDFSGQNFIDFGRVKVDSVKQLTYNFTNSGDDHLFITSAAVSGTGFTVVTPPSGDIAAGAAGSIVVKFNPSAKKSYTETLTLTAQNGVFIPPIQLTGFTPGPRLTAISPVNLGAVLVGSLAQGIFVITNSGDDTLHVTTLSLTQTATKFTLANSQGFKLPPGGVDTLKFSYTSAGESIDTALLNINSDDLGSSVRTFKFIARSARPKMAINTVDTVNFGNVNLGSIGFAPQIIADTGFLDLTVQLSGFTPDQFALRNPLATIHARSSATALLSFIPNAEGPLSGMAVVTSNDINNSLDTLYMMGTGVKSPLAMSDTIIFAPVILPAKRDTILNIKNTSILNEKIFSYKFTSGSGFIFTDTSTHTLTANTISTFRIRFAPDSAKSYSAILTIRSNDIAPIRNIILLGIADTATKGSPKLSSTETSLEFGTLDSGKNLTKTLTLTNTGTASTTITGLTLNSLSPFSKGNVNAPFTLIAGSAKGIPITFAPLSAGSFFDSVFINSSEGTKIVVPLHGIGTVPIIKSVKNIRTGENYHLTVIPNPTKDNSLIGFSVPKAGVYHFMLYDASGRLIRNVAQSNYEVGEFSLPLETKSIPSGEYTFTLSVDGQRATEVKVIVVK
ncbi:MAG: choice-of-anchor D domain-containing protein [bacterium]